MSHPPADDVTPPPPGTTDARPAPIDLFAADALRRAVTPAPPDFGGRRRRPADPPPKATDERNTVAARINEMVADGVARERASSGNLAPHWRDIERELVRQFHPPLAVVKQESIVKALAHQILRSWLDGEPRVGPVPRGVDASVETLPGSPPGLSLRSMPMEQALAVQGRWGDPATWLHVEVEITIDENGRVTSAHVTHPSGRRLFDRTALGAVQDTVRAAGPPEEHRTVVTRWVVEAAVAVAPPSTVGFRFDETGHLNPGATGWRKYVGATYPLQQSVQTHVSLVAIEP
ncbi:MAG TPA: energy transducer TonB [Polyangia bacterium]|jgi:TonB family protein|nr:energy transducer TonB [Polyangia bacterium]